MAETAAYATQGELEGLIAPNSYVAGAAWNTAAARILKAASRLFDRAAGVKEGHFLAAGAASARTFYGDGTDFLRVDPYDVTTAPAVTMPSGYTAPDYAASADDRGSYLVRTYGASALRSSFDFAGYHGSDDWGYSAAGWPDGVPVTVTAEWGYEVVPADVVQATLEIALHLWRNSDPVWMRQANVPVTPQAIPATAQLVADRYRAREMVAFA